MTPFKKCLRNFDPSINMAVVNGGFLHYTDMKKFLKQEGHDGPVSLHLLIREIHSYQTLHYLGIGLKHKTPYKD